MSDLLLDAHMRTSYDRAKRVGLAVARLGRVLGWETDDFVEEAVALVLAGQAEQAGASWGYLADYVEAADPLGRSLDADPPIDVLIGAATHDGTPLETVYRRPGRLAAELAVGGLSAVLVDERLSSEVELMASADVATAGRKAEQAYGAVDKRIVGWKRVPNVGACKWCRYIATQRYKKSQLSPAHRGCACGTEPLTKEVARGSVVDAEALKKIKTEGVPTKYGERRREARKANAAIESSPNDPDE